MKSSLRKWALGLDGWKYWVWQLGVGLVFFTIIEIILNKIVKRIINKVGIDPLVTKILINYSSYKFTQTKSLNIELDLLHISKLLLKENNFKNFQRLKKDSLNKEFI